MQKISIIGSGMVGQALAKGFLKYGYPTIIASRSEAKRNELKTAIGGDIQTAHVEEAAKEGDIIVLAVKGTAAEAAVDACGAGNLDGKVVMDATNPIADEAPENGVLRYFTDINHSLMEKLQAKAPAAKFVKAFSCVGNAYMVDPDLPGGKPTMFICGNDDDAKTAVKNILDQFGWESEDMGAVEAARAIEPLAMLWCIPGFRENRWTHAFKLLKA